MENPTKIALLLGLTLMALMGGVHIAKNGDSTISSIFPNLRSGDLQDRIEIFKEWVKKYEKDYDVDEHHVRFRIWNEAYDFVKDHNSQGKSWEVELNMFADLTNEEFAALHLGFNYDPDRVRENVQYLDESEAPEGTSWDWRKKGAVTDVKDQGSCGSCYTFSSAAALEGIYFIKKTQLIDLSEQQMLDCTSSYGNQGCSGGLMDNCFKYTQAKGIQKDSDYTYKGKVGSCAYNSAKVVFKNTGYTNVPENDFSQLRVAVKKQPVSVAVMAENNAFKLYKSGILSSDCGTDLDHAITAVGYGSGFWIVKNSWGTGWGEQGYVRIASGSQNGGKGVCGINMVNSYPNLD